MRGHCDIEVFFDGDCPLCVREMAFLRRRDRKDRIVFTDIASAEFRAQDFGFTQFDFMARIRGRLPDGSFVEGVEVFRRLYSAVGFGWLVWCTRLPGISQLLTVCYAWFARNRLRLTGRCNSNCDVPSRDGAKNHREVSV